jgi:PRTRC genetic system protein F
MNLVLPDISSAPAILQSKGSDAIAAGMALEVLARPGAVVPRLSPTLVSKAGLERAALSRALSDWADALNAQLGLMKFRMHVHTGRVPGDDAPANSAIFIGHHSREFIGSWWTLKHRWKSIESRAPGLAASALTALHEACACPIYTPKRALYFLGSVHWMGEIDESFVLAEYLSQEGGPEDDDETLTPERRQELAERFNIPTRAWFNSRIPLAVQFTKKLPHAALAKLARRRGEIGEIAQAVLDLVTAERVNPPKEGTAYGRLRFDTERVSAMGYGAALSWSPSDPMPDLFDEQAQYCFESSQEVEPAYYWQTLNAAAVREWMRAFERRLPAIRAAERLIPMIASRSR